jgi:hypothetical protein
MSDLDWDNPETIMLTPAADELLKSSDVLDEAVRRLPPR